MRDAGECDYCHQVAIDGVEVAFGETGRLYLHRHCADLLWKTQRDVPTVCDIDGVVFEPSKQGGDS